MGKIHFNDKHLSVKKYDLLLPGKYGVLYFAPDTVTDAMNTVADTSMQPDCADYTCMIISVTS